MNREIKFRMWDGQEMIYDKSNLESFFCTWEYIEDRKAPLMQYTGLKDKNGVEIYEVDIVLNKEYEENYKSTEDFIDKHLHLKWNPKGKIIFSKGTLCFTNGIRIEPIFYFENQLEVIGNIYENPELLKEEQNGRF